MRDVFGTTMCCGVNEFPTGVVVCAEISTPILGGASRAVLLPAGVVVVSVAGSSAPGFGGGVGVRIGSGTCCWAVKSAVGAFDPGASACV